MPKLGFIGVGNMGTAILEGILSKNIIDIESVYIYDSNVNRIEFLQKKYNVLTAESGSAMAFECDIILLAVKPNVCAAVLKECGNALKNKAVVSIVAGWGRDQLQAIAADSRILVAMPNTPCLVGSGMISIDMDHTLLAEELNFVIELFSVIGEVELLPSYQMAGATALAGSSPAYFYLLIEALADGGVKAGIPRDTAYKLAAQAMLGSAKLILETKQHPGVLKDAVCSPGGSTIESISALEHAGFRAAVMDAVDACVKKLQ